MFGRFWVLIPTSIAVVCVAFSARADFRSSLDSDKRTIDWTQAGVPGGIPHRTAICTTLNPGVTTDQINSAIASCKDNTVILLSAGTFNLGPDTKSGQGRGIVIARDNVTLRGAGPDKTFLVFSITGNNGGEVYGDIMVLTDLNPNAAATSGNLASWTAGYTKGITQITLSGTTGIGTGTILYLDQLADNTIITNIGTTRSAGNTTCGDCGRNSGQRILAQAVRVTEPPSGNIVKISPGLYSTYWNWKTGLLPQAWWQNSTGTVRSVGIEDLQIDGSNSNSSNISFKGTYACWVKNVNTHHPPKYDIWASFSKNLEIRNNYIHDTRVAASDNYGINFHYSSSDALVINNIFTNPAITVENNEDQGTVIAYNYATNFVYSGTGWISETNMTHGGNPHYILSEGNTWPLIYHDDVWGSSNYNVDFRNQLPGWDPGSPNASHLYPVSIEAHNSYISLVGNVLGSTAHSIDGFVNLDTSNAGILQHGNADGTKASPTILSWDSGYSQNLPASLFLSDPPSFWTTTWGKPSWPAAGPDPADPTLIHHDKIPAQLCYENTIAKAQLYNATACYSEGAPAAPHNLRLAS